jgi:hypothetical protein
MVPRFCIDRRLLGTDKHLVIDDGTFEWVPTVPNETWWLTGHCKDANDWCLDTVVRLAGAKLVTEPPRRFTQAMSLLSGSLGDTPVPWQKVMPALEHRAFVRGLVDATVAAMDPTAIDYFETVWRAGNAVFRSLKPMAIDGNRWRELVAAGEGNVPAIKSFHPGDDGFAQPICYNRFATCTGRLTVERGPQILTLKREHRDIIRSRHGDKGKVFALDFAALEVRVLLYEYGRKCDEPDLYGMIAKELGKDRKAIKGAVISELYGSSKYALGKHLGMEGKELNAFVKQIKLYFRTNELLKRVKRQFVATGYLENRYKRRVLVDEPLDHILVNYYSQSTGVDVTMLGFDLVIERLKTVAPLTCPIGTLHDALLLDVHLDELPEVQKINNVRVKGYVQSFPLRLEAVS